MAAQERTRLYLYDTLSSGVKTNVRQPWYVSADTSIQSVNTPNFGAKQKEGNLPVNPHEFKRTKRFLGIMTCDRFDPKTDFGGGPYWSQKQYILDEASHLWGDDSWTCDHEPDALNQLIVALARNAKDQKINAPVMVGEFGKVTQLVSDTASKIARAYTLVKRGNVRGAATALNVPAPGRIQGSAAQNWLELQYGWKPLLQDVHGAAEQFAKGFNNPTFARVEAYIGIRGRRGFDNTRTGESSSKVRWEERSKVTKAYGWIDYMVSNNTGAVANSMGLVNPLEVAWEMCPYSFVVDWFLPVGSYIGALGYDIGLQFIRGGYVLKSTNTVVATLSGSSKESSYPFSERTWSGNPCYSTNVWVSRKPWFAFPSVPLPSFSNPLTTNGTNRALNALALLKSAFHR